MRLAGPNIEATHMKKLNQEQSNGRDCDQGYCRFEFIENLYSAINVPASLEKLSLFLQFNRLLIFSNAHIDMYVRKYNGGACCCLQEDIALSATEIGPPCNLQAMDPHTRCETNNQ